MKKKYLFFSALLVLISFSGSFAQSCATLDITSTQDGSVCGGGSVTLSATSSGTGDEIFWYDAATGGNYLGSGSAFATPPISSTTSYWATEIIGAGSAGQVGPVSPSAVGSAGSALAVDYSMIFDVLQPTTLISVDIYPNSAIGSAAQIEVLDSSGNSVQSVSFTTTVTGGNTAQTVPLNIPLSVGADYEIHPVGSVSLYRNTSGGVYPYTSPVINITDHGFTSGSYYYYFYNWQYSTISVTCESTREEVVATVNNVADEDILSLPYTDTDDTSNFANNYSGAPGSDCGTTGSYLDGSDVVYHYQADDDYILNVELANVGQPNTAVFVYTSCADIGTSCVAGMINENATDYDFDMSVVNGQDYYFVVSSNSTVASTAYTLNIDGQTCANYATPSGSASQDFVTGQTLEDLDVTGSNLSWYSDASGTMPIASTTQLVDNTTYYVTQTFESCESSTLAVTVSEVQCSVLDVTSTTDGSVCGEGVVELTAQGADALAGTEIYWYDAATGGNYLGSGNTFITEEITATTSYWAAEVALTGGESSGHAKPAPIASTTTSLSNYGLRFDAFQAFTLVSVEVYPTTGGTMDLELRDSSGNVLETITGIVVPSGDGSTPQTVMLNLNVPAGNDLSLIKTSSGSPTMIREYSSNNSFPYSISTLGEVTSGAYNNITSTGYYWFYNWTVSEADVLCESTREEVIATVNSAADITYAGVLPYTDTDNTGNYANNYAALPGADCGTSDSYLDGNDVVYQYTPDADMVVDVLLSGLSAPNASVFIYESCYDIGVACLAGQINENSASDFGVEEFIVLENTDYFIVVSGSGPGVYDYTLTIDESVIDCADYAAAPTVADPMYFNPGDTFDDLNTGVANPIFYSDAAGTTVVTSTSAVVDGATYYVSQNLGSCESALASFEAIEFSCSSLEITSTQDNEVTCLGAMELQATGSGYGTGIYWYDAPVGGELVGSGPTFMTPELSSTTSYWASEVFVDGLGMSVGNGMTYPQYGSGSTLTDRGVIFQADQAFDLVSVDVFSTSSGGGNIDIGLFDDSGNQIASTTFNVPGGGSTSNPVQATVPLNFVIPAQGEYRLLRTSGSVSVSYEYNTASYPYDLGQVGELVGGATSVTASASSIYMYCFYNWVVSEGTLQCESAREEVVATVSTDGDVSVLTLPYNDSNNDTANYGNPYAGEPGSNCGTSENYLAGNDVLYKYTATDTELVDILLSDLDGFYAGVFVYESCGDLGSNCVAGAVAGPDDSDFGIEDFQMTAGQDYYIVISSWLNPTVGYTLDIIPFDCAALGTPDGLAAQEFAPGDLLSDLDVEATETGAPLTWYSDAAGTTEIPDTTVLVDNTTYYVSQTYNNCESGLLAITVSEIDCSTLEITSTTGDTTSCLGELELSAVASGTGSEIYWYDAATGGSIVGVGEDFMTPELTQTTSYWASEVMLDGNGVTSGWGRQGWVYNFGSTLQYGLAFEADEPFVLNTVDIFSSGNGGDLEVELYDENETLIDSYTYVGVPAGDETNPVKVTLPLYFDIPAAGKYYLMKSSSVETKYDPSSSGHSYPMQLGSVGEITGYATSGFFEYTTSYYAFYNWTIAEGEFICESVREEVVATINQNGDVTVNYTDLDYSDTNTTSLYGNNFSGDAGVSCDGEEALDGSDVVYQYVADPANDDILTIELTGLTNMNSSLFIYDSCGEIGLNCLGGMMSDGSSSIVLDDYYVDAGESLFIVVSSTSGSTNYTLNITGFDCNNAVSPEIDDASPYFIAGDMLDGIEVEGSAYATTYTWYSDAALTMVINDPTTETLVDGTTYYVTQTVLGCESAALAVTPQEFFCSDLEIVSTGGSTTVCEQGSVQLSASSGGVGSEIYWYDSPTSANPIFIGSDFVTPNVTQTTSYWVSEVFLDQSSGSSGNLPTYCVPTFSSGCSYGDDIDDFVIEVAGGGGTLLSHTSTGCSSGAYADYTSDANLTTTLVSGQTYDFEITHNYSNQWVNIYIDFNKDGDFDDANELVYEATSGANPTIASFTIPSSALGNTTVMRVVDRFAGSPVNACSPGGSYGETHDYRVTVIGASIVCESSREEVVVTVNDVIPATPTGAATQEYCEGATIGDLVAGLSSSDSELLWYMSDSSSDVLSANTLLQDGMSYYASELLDACESANRLEVAITILENSDLPTAAINQGFGTGEVLTDLDVQGNNLTWYYDQFGTQEVLDPTSEVLQDQETYYVSQTTAGNCESELLPITVHVSELNTDNPLFRDMVYYPNPAKDYLILSNSTPIESYEVYNLLGQKVMRSSANSSEVRIDTSNLSTGAYMVKVEVEGASTVFKIMKE